jgi:glucan 1,3-beta-glucosidase
VSTVVATSALPSGVYYPGYSGRPRPTGSNVILPTGVIIPQNVTGPFNFTTGHNFTANGTVPFPLNTTSLPTSTVSSVPTPSANATVTDSPEASSTSIPFLRGVNLGGWFILEKWMNPDVFTGNFANAWDQYSFDSIDGAAAALKDHWDTWITEDDITDLKNAGINALRIPIGFWAYDNANTPYVQGADAYLEKAIGWARTAGMKVWVDCHGSPGSQNGYDNSGHAGNVEWQQYNNLDRSISVLKTMAAKYGATAYSDVVVGLELTNEPISYGNNQFSVTKSWALEAYAAVRAAAANKKMIIVMHDAFETPLAWVDTVKSASAGGTFGIDTHLYQLFDDADNSMTQSQHIAEACEWSTNLAKAKADFPVYVGEWSAETNVCVNTDGTTLAGSVCTESGCQCQSNTDIEYWSTAMQAQVRRYIEAQLDTFEANTNGYFMWSAKGPDGWSLLNLINAGIFPSPITARKYADQCSSYTKRQDSGISRRRTSERRSPRGM